MPKVTLPNRWEPREYQKPFWSAMTNGCKRAMLVWHRRAGKDLTALNWMIMEMVLYRPGGAVWHVWPSYRQGRKFWEGADNTGRRYLDYFPAELIKRKRDDEMLLELKNGSIYRVVGSDDPDSLVGANPVGLIMTEFSLQSIAAWDFLRPIVTANNGTVIFPFTPRGHNHAYELYKLAKANPAWFVSVQGIDKTKALPLSVLDEERASGMSEELIQQEYFCSWTAPLSGAFYAKQMQDAMGGQRIRSVPYDPNLPVETWWDLGLDDETSIWFAQRVGQEIRLIDYEEASDRSLLDWVKVVLGKNYIYSHHVGPHDLAVREYSTGTSRFDFAARHGMNFTVAPKLPVADGIDAVRRMIPTCWFDETRCANGIEALKAYRKEFDDKRQVFRDTPYHDWASHAADAMRVGATTVSRPRISEVAKKQKVRYDPLANSRPYSVGSY